MGSIPVLKPKDVAAILVRLGFEEVRQRGSHKQFRHPDGRFTTLLPCEQRYFPHLIASNSQRHQPDN